MDVLNFIVNEILSKPALLIGMMALIGLVALRKAASAILSGTLKTILGFIILSGGGGILGAMMLGTIATVMPALVQPFMRKVNGDAGFALGHFNSLGYIVASYVGKAVGKGSKTTEDIKVPDRLGFLRDNLVMTTLVMIIVYVGLVLLAGPKSVEAAAGGGNYVMYAFT